MSFYSNDEPRGLEIVADRGRIVYAGPVRKDFWYYGIPVFTTVLFIASFAVSAYFSVPLFEADKPEYLAAPFTMVAALWTSINSKTRLCMPTFILGSLWAGASLISDAISFDLATFVFSYCCAVTLLVVIDFLKRR